MVFPNGGPLPRHPSQLYEAALEGLVLFVVLFVLARRESLRRRPGILIGVFLAGYGIARALCEVFREPDVQLGFILPNVTMGQILSLPMILIGLWLIRWASRRDPVT
jgi:phosphatidylglycerol:prolipoprotein diacylglycerol transferase